jgi:ribosomal protein S24E
MVQIKVLHEKENPLFKRKEVKISFHSEKSPSREEASKVLSEKFSIPSGNIKIKNIRGSFGSKNFDIEANLYSSKGDKDAIEFKKKKETDSEKKLEGVN